MPVDEVRIGTRDEAILAQRAKDKAARREFNSRKRARPKSAQEIARAAKQARETELREHAREILRSQDSIEAAAQPTSARFISRSDTTQDRLAAQTVGFMTSGAFVSKRREIEKEEEKKQRRKAQAKKGKKKKKKPELSKLSFAEDGEEAGVEADTPCRSKVAVNPDVEREVKQQGGSSQPQANMAAAAKLRAALLGGGSAYIDK